MEDILKNAEAPELTISQELTNPLAENYLELIREAEQAGNSDMAEYYKGKLEKLEAEANARPEASLGGWYAGYTPAEWRRMADKEYAKNGNSIEYRKCIANAQKAEG